MTDDAGGSTDIWARSTAPQSRFSMRDVGIGVAILAVGSIVAFGLPLAIA